MRISDWSSDVCSSDLMDALAEAFAEQEWGSDDAEALVDRAIERFKADPAASELAGQRDLIARCFSASSVEAILAALDEAGDDWAAKVAAIVRKQSPTSLKVTFAQQIGRAHVCTPVTNAHLVCRI